MDEIANAMYSSPTFFSIRSKSACYVASISYFKKLLWKHLA